MSKLLLVHTSTLEELRDMVAEEYNHLVQDHQKLIHVVTNLGINGLREAYLALKYCQYNNAYRTARYLYETLLLLKGLNRDHEETADIWREFKVENESLIGGLESDPLFPFEYIEKFGRLRQSERDKLEHRYPELKDLYDYLSERSHHPLRLEGLHSQHTHIPELEEDNAESALWFLVGITSEYHLAFEGTEIELALSDAVNYICNQIAQTVPGNPPVFLEEYFDFIEDEKVEDFSISNEQDEE